MKRQIVAVTAFVLVLGGSVALFSSLLAHCTPPPAPPPPPVVLPPPVKAETIEQIRERKRLFVALLLPMVQAENARLLVDRERINRIEQELAGEDDISREDFEWLKQMATDYDLDPAARRNPEFFASLRRRVDIVPSSLLVAQAAIESGWGRSQITREANNFFGHYCYGKGCGVPAPGAGDLRVFDSPEDSVKAYMHNINSHGAYRALRTQREKLRSQSRQITGTALAGSLTAYSERGDAYVADVKAMIRANQLDQLPNL